MTLTPSEIEQKTFSTALRGYNLDEVDDFLDEIVRSMRKLHQELEEARGARVEAAPVEPEPLEDVEISSVAVPVVEPPPPLPIDESAVGKALVAAQETAERIVTDARSEADQILARARSESDTFEESRLQRKADAEQEISQIDVLVDRVKSELAGLSTAVGADLDEMTRTIDAAFAELDEPIADIDDEAGDEPIADIDDEAGDEPSLEGLDDENLIASDEPEVSAEFAGAGVSDGSSGDVEPTDRVEGSEDGEDAEVETDGGAGEGTVEAGGDSGNDLDADSDDADSDDADSEDDNYLIFPDGDDDDGGDEEERSD
jgi:DivIVA domain-containing protein